MSAARARPPARADPRPACLITGEVSPYRVEPFRLLAEAENVEIVAWGGSAEQVDGLVVHETTQAGAARLAASGRYRAVICGLGGRIALPGAFVGARIARAPFVLWASVWAHPRSAAHLLSYMPTRFLYRHADAVVTYGPHVSAYVRARRGGRGGVFEAAQAVSADHFGAPASPERMAAARETAGAAPDGRLVLFVGRLEREKGVEVLLRAWRRSGLGGRGARLALAGEGPLRPCVERAGDGVVALGRVSREELPALYAAADVLVLPSIRTATFLEPWGLVVNEAMLQGTPVIASDAVGAVAGGLVRDGRNGLVVKAGSEQDLADRVSSMCNDRALRERLGDAARQDVIGYSEQEWAGGVGRALRSAETNR